jgi:hypothetical protein
MIRLSTGVDERLELLFAITILTMPILSLATMVLKPLAALHLYMMVLLKQKARLALTLRDLLQRGLLLQM